MPHTQFCSNCRAENLHGATVCERCSAPLSETESNSFDQKLILALHQPIPEMRDMAAILLGQRGNRQALPVLLSRLREETDIGTLNAINPIGIVIGLAIPFSVRFLTAYRIPISGLSAIIAIIVSSLVGIIFGTLPATRAAELDPVESLRYE